ncbi:hypothetical protein BDA99DRAFT_561725 [Phascolomyces articulosus]|uniref:Uncharacterized protein n=1 Tax=Phascolomyces articulosus TaxID=60185 RepID=A0AAD5JWA9_9FUNG|nr:hypothetical protein BDA99DRAFT_561725 [Phascolomyces articulosus]
MKITWIIINITLCVVALLFAQDVNADTQEQAIAYLKKYKIPFQHKANEAASIISDGAISIFDSNKKSGDDELLKTVKYYRDSVVMNLDLFGEKIDRLLKGLQIKLEKQHQINKNNIDALIEMLQHGLRRLELRGELTREKVFTELDRLKRKAIEQHIVDEAQWKQLVNDIAGSFATDAWYRRFLGGRYHLQHENDDDGFSRWKRHLENRLKEANKMLSPDQVEQSLDTVQRAIHNTPDATKLANPRWWRRVERDLKRTLNNPDLVKDVVDSVRDDVNAYKIFAMDYAPEDVKNWIQEWCDWAHDLWNEFIQWLYRQYNDVNTPEAIRASSTYAVIEAHSRSVDMKAHSAETAIQSFTQAVDQAATQWRKSFAKFWLEQEKQAFKRIGYTEAHLEWIHDHLEKTIKDHTSLAKHNIDASLYQIRRYLQEAKVQSATQIEHQITRIQSLLEVWKKSLPTNRVEL